MDDESALRAAADNGDVNAMAQLGYRLVGDFTLAHELGMPSPYRERVAEGIGWLVRAGESGHVQAMLAVAGLAAQRQRPAEEEQWLRRAAETDDLGAVQRLWGFLANHGRRDEAAACYQRMLPRLAEAGDPSAMRTLARQLALEGRHDEAETWHGRLPFQPIVDCQEIGRSLAGRGRIDEARRWYRRGAATGDMHALAWVGKFEEEYGDLAAAEQWYRRSVEAGAGHAMVSLGLVLERLGRLDEAERWLTAAPGTMGAHELVAFLLRHGRTEEAERERCRMEGERWRPVAGHGRGGTSVGSAPDPLTVATSVVITTAVLPFVQALAAKAAEGTYDGVRALLRKLAATYAKRHGPMESALLIVDDPNLGLKLHMRTDEGDEALRALGELEQAIKTPQRPRGGKLVWDSATRTWRTPA